MKKIYLLLLLILPLMASCSNDEDDDKIASSLAGTKWEGIYETYWDKDNKILEEKDVYTITFLNNEKFSILWITYEYDENGKLESDDSDLNYTIKGEYEVEGTTVTLITDDGEIETFIMKNGKLEGRFDGTKITFKKK